MEFCRKAAITQVPCAVTHPQAGVSLIQIGFKTLFTVRFNRLFKTAGLLPLFRRVSSALLASGTSASASCPAGVSKRKYSAYIDYTD
jgi:hypothetical protein